MEKYNVTYLLWMIRYTSLFTNAFTQWILIGAECFLNNSPAVVMRWDTSMTLDAAMWKGAVRKLSSCIIINSISIIIFGTLLEQIYPFTFSSFLFHVLIYMFMFLMYCDLHTILIRHINL